jgi:hypothetical protein
MAGAGRNREFLAGRIPWGSPGILRGASRGGLRGTGPAVAQETQGGNLSRCPRDDQGVRLHGSLRPGPAAAQPTKPLRKKMQPARPIQLKSLRLKGLANRSGECFGCLRLVHRGS